MFNTIRRRARSARALPAKPQVDQLGARIDNVEQALHREVHEIRREIDERVFALFEMMAASTETRLGARIDSATQAAVTASIAASQEHTEAAVEAALETSIAVAREHAEAAIAVAVDISRDQVAQLRTELARLQRILERVEPTHSDVGPPAAFDRDLDSRERVRTSEIDDLLYLAIEDRFRGDPSEIRSRQERYVPLLPAWIDEAHPLLDLGCGRGEWLQVLADAGVPARGLDSNASCVEECRAAGLTADVGDLVATLAGSDDHSLGAVSMFHVVEHLPFGILAGVMRECARVLLPGGLLIVETPNALNLRVAAINFWLDPTHVRPLHPELLRLLAERGGFSRTRDLFLNDIGVMLEVPDESDHVGAWLKELSRSLDGAGDYALLAWTPGLSTS